jgi:nicotinate phosphoribosyltransferase
MTWVDDSNAPLLTDLYQLKMLHAYFEEGMDARATFDLSVRELPPTRNFLVACGLDDVLGFLETLSFDAQAVAHLARLGQFSTRFLDCLRQLRFTGDVFAVPEGTVVFAGEPIVEVVAPLPRRDVRDEPDSPTNGACLEGRTRRRCGRRPNDRRFRPAADPRRRCWP